MKNKYISIALIVIIIILVFLLSSFIGDIRRLYTTGVFVRPSSIHDFYRTQRKLSTPSDVNLIAKWMTFSYINKSFNLPPDYLKTTLNISNIAYPNLTISKIAKEQGISISVYLETLKNAVSAYLAQNTPPK